MSSIVHKEYSGGEVQSLGFSTGGVDHTVGVVMPGEYDFGLAERREVITCKFNKLTVNGVTISPFSKPVVIRPGEPIKISTKEVAVYHCMYR